MWKNPLFSYDKPMPLMWLWLGINLGLLVGPLHSGGVGGLIGLVFAGFVRAWMERDESA